MNATTLAVSLIRQSETVFQKLEDQLHPIRGCMTIARQPPVSKEPATSNEEASA